MPVQKGKTRKRPRKRRVIADVDSEVYGDAPATPVSRDSRAPGGITNPFGSRRQLPLWANAVIGVVLLALGGLFALTPQRGLPSGWNIAVLVGYIGLAVYYLSKALRQYRGQRNA